MEIPGVVMEEAVMAAVTAVVRVVVRVVAVTEVAVRAVAATAARWVVAKLAVALLVATS